MSSLFKTFVFLAVLTALFGSIGLLIGGTEGMLIALILAAAMNVFAYWNSDKLALRVYSARQIDQSTAPNLFQHCRKFVIKSWFANAPCLHYRKPAA